MRKMFSEEQVRKIGNAWYEHDIRYTAVMDAKEYEITVRCPYPDKVIHFLGYGPMGPGMYCANDPNTLGGGNKIFSIKGYNNTDNRSIGIVFGSYNRLETSYPEGEAFPFGEITYYGIRELE